MIQIDFSGHGREPARGPEKAPNSNNRIHTKQTQNNEKCSQFLEPKRNGRQNNNELLFQIILCMILEYGIINA